MAAFLESIIQSSVPASLQDQARQRVLRLWQGLQESQQRQLQSQLASDGVLAQQLLRSLTVSDYLYESCCREPHLLFDSLLVDAPYNPITAVKVVDMVETACSDQLELADFDRRIRRLRRRLMTDLYWRDANGLADFTEVSQAMTAMAEVFIQQTLDFHYRLLIAKHGQPAGAETGLPQPMLVVGMGKLGGGELNVSSDIDLIFAFPEAGSTVVDKLVSSKQRSIDNQKFFTLLGQRLIKSLSDITEEGFVFRVDMRLRPYGQSGALVSNFAALENYYESQGRDWERFAAVKARVVACSTLADASQSLTLNHVASTELDAILQPFVYRRYIDFSMIDSLRQLKALIEQELRRKGLETDIKLGAGGIREVEFIAQAIQLIRGGRDKRLQQRHLLTVLKIIAEAGYVNADEVATLQDGYVFLRQTEHALQAQQDAQTQVLPQSDFDRQRLAWVMGFGSWPDLLLRLDAVRREINTLFQRLIATNDEAQQPDDGNHWGLFWQQPEVEQLPVLIQQHKAKWQGDKKQDLQEQAQAISDAIIAFQASRKVNSLSAQARARLDTLMPQLLQAIEETVVSGATEPAARQYPQQFLPQPLQQPFQQPLGFERLLTRVLTWLESIVTRTSYLVLLVENPQVLQQLLHLLAESPWVASTLSQLPSLLDELMAPEKLYALPDKAELGDQLRQRLLRIAPDDVEANMEALRYFRLAQQLQIAACEIEGSLPLMKVSDYLSYTAELILEHCLQLAWQAMTARHGYPPDASDSAPRFIVVGYGKLGGIEMGYSSDLDLVFVYDADAQAMTDGLKSLDCQTFYTRLGQKLIHYLTTRTLSGPLYEVDMRLRPSGNSGLLVSSMSAYSRYQRESAWVWEHQALVRARGIAGDPHLLSDFASLRRQVLGQQRDLSRLKAEVLSMREKMRQHLGSAKPRDEDKAFRGQGRFNLKQDAGGIVDIEFMVQYAVLAWSHPHPALSEWTDNIRILDSLQQSGLLETAQAHQLIDIYQTYRAASHRLVLQQQPSSLVESDAFATEREQVRAIWQDWFEGV